MEIYHRIVADLDDTGEVQGAVLEESTSYHDTWQSIAYIVFESDPSSRFAKFEDIKWTPVINCYRGYERMTTQFVSWLGKLGRIAETFNFPMENVEKFEEAMKEIN